MWNYTNLITLKQMYKKDSIQESGHIHRRFETTITKNYATHA